MDRLDDLARREHVSRAEIMRRAVASYNSTHGIDIDVFGLWSARTIDGLAYEDRLRKEWHRK